MDADEREETPIARMEKVLPQMYADETQIRLANRQLVARKPNIKMAEGTQRGNREKTIFAKTKRDDSRRIVINVITEIS